MITLLSPYFLWSGYRAMAPIAVVQLGLEMYVAPLATSALISGMTSGTPSVYRNTEELSITTVFLGPPATFMPYSLEISSATAKKQISHSCAAATLKSSIVTLPNAVSTVSPRRCLSKRRSLSAGKPLSSKHFFISEPTTPKAPATPTVPTLVRVPDTADRASKLAGRLATLPDAMRDNILKRKLKVHRLM